MAHTLDGAGGDAVSFALNSRSNRYDGESQTFVYGIDSQASNSWKSSNPHSGVHLDDTVKTLDASGPDFARNQGGSAVVTWQNRQQSGEVRIQEDTMPTVSKQWGTGGNNVPFVGVRRLTPTECERLQGFPDGWTAEQSDSARYRQLGNAVAVPVIEWIARRIVEVHQ